MLTTYGTDLSGLGSVTIAPVEMFLFLGGTDNSAIAAVSYTGDDFYLGDIGFNVRTRTRRCVALRFRPVWFDWNSQAHGV